jgi:hypothetical protein
MRKLGRRTVAMLAGATALIVGPMMSLPGASAAPSSPTIPTIRPGHAMYDTGIKHTVSPASVAALGAASSTEVKHFSSTVTVGSTTYTYSMIGKNPAKAHTNPASSINTYLVPVVIKFGTFYKWDPTVGDNCDPGGSSASTRTQNSPIFASQSWTWGGTPIGTGQVTDAFQRANFWQYAKPGGLNPGYAVNLNLTVLPKVTISVPLSDAAVAPIACGNGALGAVEINWLDNYLQTHLIPSLASQGVSAANFPIFLLHNVVEYINNTSNCCVLGYHNAYGSNPIHTYALAMYDNSATFSGSSDISALSHEVGEWMDDPYTNNPTPSWGNIGQVSGCQTNLEVGDPLSGTNFSDTVGGFTYNPQELAFFSWFYRQSPSLGVNGWYSDQGTFTTYSAPC